MMRVSLRQFLVTGALGDLRIGSAEQELHSLIGRPDAEGYPSGKQRFPPLVKYGDVELHFSQSAERSCNLIYVERQFDRDRFVFPRTWIVEDWDLQPGTSRVGVENFLNMVGLSYQEAEKEALGREIIVRPSHVRITFDDDGLWAFALAAY